MTTVKWWRGRVSARFRELCASESVQLTTSIVPGYDKALQDSES